MTTDLARRITYSTRQLLGSALATAYQIRFDGKTIAERMEPWTDADALSAVRRHLNPPPPVKNSDYNPRPGRPKQGQAWRINAREEE